MPATSGCFTSLRKLATLTAVVGALCRLADAANATCSAGYEWAFNSLGQSPCDVTAALGGACIIITGGNFSLDALSPGYVYLGPAAGLGTPCRCSTVYYSTLSACALCQGANFIKWTAYNANCTSVYTEIFPSPIPSGFSVPHWAYLDVIAANTFDPTAAKAAATSGPDSTGFPQATGSTTPSTTTYPSSSKKKTNVGAIAGGVAGGVVGLALIGGVVFCLLRRRQIASSQPTPGTYDPQPFTSYEKSAMGTMDTGNTGTAFASTPMPKLYDPDDPSTFPVHAAQNYTGTTNTLSTPEQPLYPNLPNFGGSPQIPLGPGGHNQYAGSPEL